MSRGRYHVSEDGQVRPCEAESEETCRAKGPDGERSPHFESEEAGDEYARQFMEKEHGVVKTLSREAVSEKMSENLKGGFEVGVKNEINEGMGVRGWRGSKSDPLRSLPEVAEILEKDLDKAVNSGYLPEEFEYELEVRERENILHIHVKNLPSDSEVYDYSTKERESPIYLAKNGKTTVSDIEYDVQKRLKPEYQSLKEKVQSIHDSYNYRRTNRRGDLMSKGFSGVAIMEDDSSRAESKLDELRKVEYRAIVDVGEDLGLRYGAASKNPEVLSHPKVKEAMRSSREAHKESEKIKKRDWEIYSRLSRLGL